MHIELAREMKLPKGEKQNLAKIRDENEKLNQKFVKEIQSWGIKPTGTAITKYKLWKEQDHKCAYSGKEISPNELFELTEIDHILPFSRSLDDSKSNKVLVFASENQQKRDRTPYEYFGSDTERWERMLNIWENVIKLPPGKIMRLTIKDFKGRSTEEFLDRDLNDTKYASRFIKNYIEQNLLFKNRKLLKEEYTHPKVI